MCPELVYQIMSHHLHAQSSGGVPCDDARGSVVQDVVTHLGDDRQRDDSIVRSTRFQSVSQSIEQTDTQLGSQQLAQLASQLIVRVISVLDVVQHKYVYDTSCYSVAVVCVDRIGCVVELVTATVTVTVCLLARSIQINQQKDYLWTVSVCS